MKKSYFLWILLDLVFLIIFNAVFFVLGGFDHKLSVWISYGFIHFAYLMLLVTPMLLRQGKSFSIFGFTLFSVASAYFIIEFVVGVIFILLAQDSYQAALLVQLCIAGCFAILLIANMIANERTAEAEEKQQAQVEYVKNSSSALQGLIDNIEDEDTKKAVRNVCDVLASSPVKSHPKLAPLETQIMKTVTDFSQEVADGNNEKIIALADDLLKQINERNRQLQLLN